MLPDHYRALHGREKGATRMDYSATTQAFDADLQDEEAAQIAMMEAQYDDWNTMENDWNERLVREAGFAEF
jgi:hypothetical protein